MLICGLAKENHKCINVLEHKCAQFSDQDMQRQRVSNNTSAELLMNELNSFYNSTLIIRGNDS